MEPSLAKLPREPLPHYFSLVREEAVSSAALTFSDAPSNEPPVIFNQLLGKNWGVRSRIEFDEDVHDRNYLIPDFEGQSWCNEVICWMAYKVKFISAYVSS